MRSVKNTRTLLFPQTEAWTRVKESTSHIDEEKQAFTTLTTKSISKEEAHVGLNIYREFLSLL